MEILINTHGNPMPEKHGEWIDLCTAEDVEMQKGEYRLISLGVSMQLPSGYYAQVVPRSSAAGRWKIAMANSIGIIENEYCGDDDVWHFPAIAFDHAVIPKGTRIAQFRAVKQEEPVQFMQVDALGNKNRGGFGSTG